MQQKNYGVIEVTSNWTGSGKSLVEHVEQVLNEKTQEGYEIVNISFVSQGMTPVAFITLCK